MKGASGGIDKSRKTDTDADQRRAGGFKTRPETLNDIAECLNKVGGTDIQGFGVGEEDVPVNIDTDDGECLGLNFHTHDTAPSRVQMEVQRPTAAFRPGIPH
jgi:hypothetical protein